MKRSLFIILALLTLASTHAVAQTARDVQFYSEGIQCYGKLFTPAGFAADGKAPAVVLAPGRGETAAMLEKHAAQFAARGLVALTLDYRGWGRSGGFLQTVEPVKSDDRLRFSQMTARVRIQRQRILPQQQLLDIRNALYFLQGEPGVDRTRVGVWGAGLAGGHVLVIAATDARVKAVVAHAPLIAGKDVPRKAAAPTGALLRAEQQRARTGRITQLAETQLALAEYQPFWYVEQIPATTAVLFVAADKDAQAAAQLLKGPQEVVNSAADKAISAAADWFLKHL